MRSRGTIEDYTYLRDLDSRGISQVNAEYLRDWIVYERGNGLALTTINTDISKMIWWLRDIKVDDAAEITDRQVLRAYSDRLDRVAKGDYSDATLDVDVVVLRKFISWLHRDNEKGRSIVPIKRKKHPNTRSLDEYITQEQVIAMRDYALKRGDIRGAALIMIFFGTGCRRGEIYNANVGDVKIGRTHATIKLDGKTGKRQTPFVVSLPEVQDWINCHPCQLADGKPDPDAPLFVTYNTRGHGNVRLSKKRIGSYVRDIATAIGIPKNIKASPHAMRHLSATLNARGLTSAEMNAYYGWSPRSQMPTTYVHTSEEQLQKTILRQNGVIEETPVAETSAVVQCPRCKSINSARARYCSTCSLILDSDLATVFRDATSDLEDPDVLKLIVDNKSR